MFGKTLFLTLGLIAAMTLGCEKKAEAPAAPTDKQVEDAADGMKKDADKAMEEGKEKMDEAAEKVGEAAEKVGEAAEDMKDKLPE